MCVGLEAEIKELGEMLKAEKLELAKFPVDYKPEPGQCDVSWWHIHAQIQVIEESMSTLINAWKYFNNPPFMEDVKVSWSFLADIVEVVKDSGDKQAIIKCWERLQLLKPENQLEDSILEDLLNEINPGNFLTEKEYCEWYAKGKEEWLKKYKPLESDVDFLNDIKTCVASPTADDEADFLKELGKCEASNV